MSLKKKETKSNKQKKTTPPQKNTKPPNHQEMSPTSLGLFINNFPKRPQEVAILYSYPLVGVCIAIICSFILKLFLLLLAISRTLLPVFI